MDPIEEWTAAQLRVCDLVASQPEDALDVPVPATPAWRARDLLAHMIGLDADVVAGTTPDEPDGEWTQSHVDARRDRTVAELVTEWNALVSPVQDWMRANDSRPLGDVIIHEQDLRGALGISGAQSTGGLDAIRDRMAGGVAEQARELPVLALTGPTWQWQTKDGEVAVRLEASDFDLARALMSRRSADQLRSWTTTGDVDPFLDAFAGLGPLPEQSLHE